MPFEDIDALLDGPASASRSGAKPDNSALPLVLVVDDDDGIRRSMELFLSDHYRLSICPSAVEGVAAFNGDVCAVVLDVKMRGYDGFWACDQIRMMQPDVPVIFYSGYQDAKDPFEIINAHRPFAYLSKDASPQKLLDVLATATQLFQSTLRMRRLLDRLKPRR